MSIQEVRDTSENGDLDRTLRYVEKQKTIRTVVFVFGGIALAAFLAFLVDWRVNQNVATNDYRSFLSEYVKNGIEQDIEIRIRFTEYFQFVEEDEDLRDRWALYHSTLVSRRDRIQGEILSLRRELALLQAEESSLEQKIRINEIVQELEWLNVEVLHEPVAVREVSNIVTRPDASVSGVPNFPGTVLQDLSDKALSLNVTQVNENPGGGTYSVSVTANDETTKALGPGGCRYLAAVAGPGELWVQPGEIAAIPTTVRWSMSNASRFPTTLLVLQGEENFCSVVDEMFSNGAYRSLANEFYSELGSLTVSRVGCTFNSTKLNDFYRPGQTDQAC